MATLSALLVDLGLDAAGFKQGIRGIGKSVSTFGAGQAMNAPTKVISQAPTMPRMTWDVWQQTFAPNSPITEPGTWQTKEELFAALEGLGCATNWGQVRSWQFLGIIPGSIRRRRGGATRSLFPSWMAALLQGVCEMRTLGIRLETISVILRAQLPDIIDSGTRPDWTQFIATGLLAVNSSTRICPHCHGLRRIECSPVEELTP